MSTARIALVVALFTAACGGASTPPATTAEAPVQEPASPATAEAPTETTETPAPSTGAKKASTMTIDGASVSAISGEQLVAALKKRGFEGNTSPTLVGKYEQVGFSAHDKKTKETTLVAISRWAEKAREVTDATSEADFAPKAIQAKYAESGGAAQAYDAEADVLVSVVVVGAPAKAKKLLGSLVEGAK